MTASVLPQSERVRELLGLIEQDRAAMLKLGMSVFGTAGSAIFPLDLVASGAVKRNISVARAFSMMVESWNLVCARALLRIHIDTALRFSAAWLVDKPHEFATAVAKGERIDKLKAKDGQRLTDAYLVQIRSNEHPWLPDVYKNLSGYVHFSGSHIYDSVATVDMDEATFSLEVSDTDTKFPESSWIEVMECFREATAMLAKFLHRYAVTKRITPEELRKAREK